MQKELREAERDPTCSIADFEIIIGKAWIELLCGIEVNPALVNYFLDEFEAGG